MLLGLSAKGYWILIHFKLLGVMGMGVEDSCLEDFRLLLSRDNGIYIAFGFEYCHFIISEYRIFPSFLCWWSEWIRNLLYIHCLRWVIVPLDLLDIWTLKGRHIDSIRLSSVMIGFSIGPWGITKHRQVVVSYTTDYDVEILGILFLYC